MSSVTALLTSHNRRRATTAAIDAWFDQRVDGDVELRAVLADASSSDGTADAVAGSHPRLSVVSVDADVFWNAGMRAAWSEAALGDPDWYVWLNDDTVLDPTALATLLDVAAAQPGGPIVVGSVRDPDTGSFTYGGVRRHDRLRPLRFEYIQPVERPEQVETMNGNVVLVPREAYRRIGSLDPAFSHGMGDFDYGLRARREGFEVWLAPGTVGTCARNEPKQPPSGPLEAWRRLRSPKGLPLPDWLVFARRWGGLMWPVYAASPYVRSLARAFSTRIRSTLHRG